MIKIHDHFPLRDISIFKTGGVTEYYVNAETLADIFEAVTSAINLGATYRVVGATTGLLMSDAGFPGMVIQNKSHSVLFLHDRSQVIVDAGTPVNQLLAQTISLGYSGLEFLTGAKGSIGGAVYRNLSQSGVAIGAYVRAATLLFPPKDENLTNYVRKVDSQWFEFGPTSSRLKKLRLAHPNFTSPIILSITLQLSKMNHASCMQKLKHYAHQQSFLQVPSGDVLQVFDSLRLNENRSTSESKSDKNLFYIEKSMVRQWHKNAIAAYSANPNYICNTNLGLSRDAGELIDTIQNQIEINDLHPQPIVERFGMWD